MSSQNNNNQADVNTASENLNENSAVQKTIGENPQKTWAEVVAKNIPENSDPAKTNPVDVVQIEGLESVKSAVNDNAKVSLVDTLTFDRDQPESEESYELTDSMTEGLNYSDVKDRATEDAKWAKDRVTENFEYAKDQAGKTVENVKETVTENYDYAKDQAAKTAEIVKDKVAENYDYAKDQAGKTVENVKETVTENYDYAKDQAGKTAEIVKETVTETAENVKETVTENYDYAKDQAAKTAEIVKDTVAENYEYAKDQVLKTAENVKENAESAQEGIASNLTAAKDFLVENVTWAKDQIVDNLHYQTTKPEEKDPRPESFKKPADELAKELHEKVPVVNTTQQNFNNFTIDPRPERIQKPADELAKELHEKVPLVTESQLPLNKDLDSKEQDQSSNEQPKGSQLPVNDIIVTNLPMPTIPTVTDVLTENLNYAKDVIVDSAVALKETFLPGFKLVRDDSPSALSAPKQTPSMKAREMHERTLAENL